MTWQTLLQKINMSHDNEGDLKSQQWTSIKLYAKRIAKEDA